jgi:hypothetical protein
MIQIKGKIQVSQKDWKSVYGSILNFVNEEINFAYNNAQEVYSLALQQQDTESFLNKLSLFKKHLITTSIFKNEKLYKPKKKDFSKFTNRSTEIDLIDWKIKIDKIINAISIETIKLNESFEERIHSDLFLQQLLTMLQTIEWPTKQGPVKATRGCTLTYIDFEQTQTKCFFQQGANPPIISFDFDETLKEPKFLKSKPLYSLKVTTPKQFTNKIYNVPKDFY